MPAIRDVRKQLKLSQSQFAALLGVSPDTYRTWDSGRQETPAIILARAREHAKRRPEQERLSLPELARVLGIHTHTLRKAARDGRLAVTYDTRVFFGKLITRTSRRAGEAFKRIYYRRTTRWNRPVPPRAVPGGSRRLSRARRGASATPQTHPSAARHTGRCRQQGGRVPVGIAEAPTVTLVLEPYRTGCEPSGVTFAPRARTVAAQGPLSNVRRWRWVSR